MELRHKLAIFWALLMVLFIFTMIAEANGQSVGPSFGFSDVSLSHSDLKVYEENNGSMSYVSTINSTSQFIYDPTSNYVIVFQPDIANTYGSSPEGIAAFINDNPELAALFLIIIIIVGLVCIMLLVKGRR